MMEKRRDNPYSISDNLKSIFIIFFVVLILNSACFAQTDFISTNLPIIVINTNGKPIPNEPKLDATMGIIDNGPGIINNITDPFNGYNGKIGIEIRGQSTQQFPKKQYGIETRDDAGSDLAVSLLGLPSESDWVLNANYLDKTFMRNVLAYKLYNDFGRYATRTRFCEVVLNGEYIGLYILQEKIKRDNNRVDISRLDPEDISGDDLTGGYIFRIDKVRNADVYWSSPFAPYEGTNSKINYQYYYPDPDEITTEQKNYIREYVTAFETTMNSPTYNDPFANYLDYIDIDSFVDMYVFNEFTKVTDAYRISTYFYKDRGGKLVAGPPWDFDIAFGIANYDNGFDPAGWQVFVKNGTSCENPFWSGKLFNDSIFKNKFVKRWHEVKNTVFSADTIDKFIDETLQGIDEALTRNFNKWKILGLYVWPNRYIFKTHAEEINYLKNWIKERTDWMNAELPATYSTIEWYERDLTELNFEVNIPKTLHRSYFVKSSQNISSIDLLCQDANVRFNSAGDSLTIIVQRAGNYTIKGVALNDGSVISISPKYNITAEVKVEPDTLLPQTFRLFQNYPNPFNSGTIIEYQTKENCFVQLKVIDILGRKVSTLVNEEKQTGNYKIEFDGGNLPSGVYFYCLAAGQFTDVKKMVLLR
ncbi:MAG: CotH kinase family protein [bacterium]